jgi:hypothetical protein
LGGETTLPKSERLKKMKSLSLPVPPLLLEMSKVGIGLIAVGSVIMAGAATFILKRRHASHQESYESQTDAMEERLRSTISDAQDESEEVREVRVQSVGSAQEPLNEWNRKSWIEKAIFPPPIPPNEVEMQELNTSGSSGDSSSSDGNTHSTLSSSDAAGESGDDEATPVAVSSSDEAVESGDGTPETMTIITDEEAFGSFYKGAPTETKNEEEAVQE